jgi:hypothetical protein
MYMPGFMIPAALAVLSGAAWALHLRKRNRPSPADLRWLEELTLGGYRPMERLLLDADYKFLAARAGSGRRMARSLRWKRCRIMLHYLGRLERDYRRAERAAKLKIALSREEGGRFSLFLLGRSVLFGAGCMRVRMGVVIHGLIGFAAPDVRPLLASAELLLARASQYGRTTAPALAA